MIKKTDKITRVPVPIDTLLDIRFLLGDLVTNGNLKTGFVNRCNEVIEQLNETVFHNNKSTQGR